MIINLFRNKFSLQKIKLLITKNKKMKDKKVKIKSTEKNGESWQTINKGKPIFYKDVKHWIVYEFNDKILIARNEDLTGVFCVSKKQVHA